MENYKKPENSKKSTTPNLQEFINQYDYKLPSYLIAKYPPAKRGLSNLMIYLTQTNELIFTKYYKLHEFIPSETLIVRNTTKVIKARIFITPVFKNSIDKKNKKVELFIISFKQRKNFYVAEALLRMPLKKLKRIKYFIWNNWKIKIRYNATKHIYIAHFSGKDTSLIYDLERFGHVPIPPYLKRNDKEIDIKRYQTVFAINYGSVAAPTASLNFTKGLEKRLQSQGNILANINLHIGLGTFSPVRGFNLTKNKLHKEEVFIAKQELYKIYRAKINERPILAIGTTVVRALESLYYKNIFNPLLPDQTAKTLHFTTDLFIKPPFEFKIIDFLLTNFHYPKSSLLMLVDSFLKYKQAQKNWKELYDTAITEKLKLLSYGDSLLIL